MESWKAIIQEALSRADEMNPAGRFLHFILDNPESRSAQDFFYPEGMISIGDLSPADMSEFVNGLLNKPFQPEYWYAEEDMN